MRCFRRIPSILVLAWVLVSSGASMEDASEVTWAHAVNSREALERELAGTVDFLEADVTLGQLEGHDGPPIPVMAHPPVTSSDISLDQWLLAATSHGGKGIKLDFKGIDVLEPSLLILQQHSSKLNSSSLWLNADILPGPVDSPTLPVDADEFLSKCRQHFPSGTLSVGWTTYWHPVFNPSPSAWRYGWHHVRKMADALHCGLYTSAPRSSNVISRSSQGHPKVTFPVRGIFAARSIGVLRWLLSVIPGSSLTVWSGRYDPLEVNDLLRIRSSFPMSKVYYDVPEPLREEFVKQKNSVPVPPEDKVTEEDDRWTTLYSKGDGEGCSSLTYAGDSTVVFGRSATTAVLWKTPLDPGRIRVEGLVEFFPQVPPPTSQEVTLVLAEVSRFAKNSTSQGDEQDMTTSDTDVVWSAITASAFYTFRLEGREKSSCRAFRLDAAADKSFQAWTVPCDALHDDQYRSFERLVTETGVTEVSSRKRLVLPEEPLVFGIVSRGDGHVAVHNLSIGGAGDVVTSSVKSVGVANVMLTLWMLFVGLSFFL